MAKWTQAARKMAINTELGTDELILQGFDLTDEMSRPFVCEVTLYSENTEIDFDAIVGENVTLRLEQGDGGTRFINGYVARFTQGGGDGGDAQNLYYATIVPWLWFLTRSTDCRIFQDMDVKDILDEIFTDFGCGEMVEDTLTATYGTLEYVVQYRETAFNFVSRLMEHEGIYYFFKHEDGKHKLVLCDAPSAHEEVEGYEEIPCQDNSQADKQGVTEWSHEARLMPGRYTLRDFDFKVPGKDLESEKAITQEHALAGWAVFDSPGDYVEKDSGDTRASTRMEELAAQYSTFRAKSDARGLTVGAKFKLSGAPRDDENAEYVITSMTAQAQEDSFGSREEEPEELFKSEFTCIPAETQFRPRRTTLKPLINGPQTAIVTGPSGEEVETDEFGRVKVHFHWDRWSAADDKSSCWIRVAQLWAGKKFGSMFIPRVGQEVIVEFLEGDPDRPIITGRVYNGECQVPYDLPDNKTRSTIKTCSSKGGDGFNELRFEDKKGDEQVFVHAEKDMDVRVKEIRKDWIGKDRHLIVKEMFLESVEKSKHLMVTEDMIVKIDGGYQEAVKQDKLESVGGDNSLDVTGDRSSKVGGNDGLTVTGDAALKVGSFSVDSGSGDIHLKSGGLIAIQGGSEIHLKATKIIIEADSQVSLVVGGNFIDISSSQAWRSRARWA